jgi:hypothetical protein
MAGVSRRSLITKGALAAAGAMVALPDLVGAAIRATTPSLEPVAPRKPATDTPWLSRPHLAAHVGDTFHVEVEGRGRVAARLARLDDVSCAATTGLQGSAECFTAVFDTGEANPIRQGTYTVRHARMGRFSLFLVPAGTSEQGHACTATINRVRA